MFSLLPVPIIGQLLGIGGIVLGVIVLGVIVLGVIVLEVIALRRARTGGHGTGRAITAIALGSIGTIFGAIVLFNIAFST